MRPEIYRGKGEAARRAMERSSYARLYERTDGERSDYVVADRDSHVPRRHGRDVIEIPVAVGAEMRATALGTPDPRVVAEY